MDVRQLTEKAVKANNEGRGALDLLAKSFKASEIFLALDAYADEFGLITYYKKGSRQPKYRIDVRYSADTVTAKDDDFRYAALQAMALGYTSFVKDKPKTGAPSLPDTEPEDFSHLDDTDSYVPRGGDLIA